MSDINTLVEDMHKVLTHVTPHVSLTVESQAAFGARVANHLEGTLTPRDGGRTSKRVWFSQLGTKCLRREWYAINTPEKAAPLPPEAKYKFLYGHIIEETTLQLAKAAGHKVEREQERIELPIEGYDGWAVTGRIDAIVDGVVIDVKSMSTYSYNDMPSDISLATDTFGYRWQLNGYNAVLGWPKRPALLCVDKQLGHIKLAWETNPMPMAVIQAQAENIVRAAQRITEPFRRELVPQGTSGNMKLDTYCSYCPYKHTCWPTIRTFLYSNKPIDLVEVVVEPKVPEFIRTDASE